jgi:hypothetical protein
MDSLASSTRQVPTRFVLLLHTTDGSSYDGATHWDFMIEISGADPQCALRTWALESRPRPGKEITATELALHRLEYLEYEGPVSGHRGCVQRVDQGHYEMIEANKDSLTMRLFGQTICGTVTLRRGKNDTLFLMT